MQAQPTDAIASVNRSKAQLKPLTKLKKRRNMKRFRRVVKEDGVTVAKDEPKSLEFLFNYITTKVNIADLLSFLVDIQVDKEQRIFLVQFIKEDLDRAKVDAFLSEITAHLPYKIEIESEVHLMIGLADEPIKVVPDDGETVQNVSDVSGVGKEQPEEPEEFEPTGFVDDMEFTGETKSEEENKEESIIMKESCPGCRKLVDVAENLTEALKVKCPACGHEFEIKLMTDDSGGAQESPQPPSGPAEPTETPPPESPGSTPAEPSGPAEEPKGKGESRMLKSMECLECNSKFISEFSVCPKCSSTEVHNNGTSSKIIDETIESIMRSAEAGKITLEEAILCISEGVSDGSWVGPVSEFNLKITAISQELGMDSTELISSMEKADLLKTKDDGVVFDIEAMKEMVKKMLKESIQEDEETAPAAEPMPEPPPAPDAPAPGPVAPDASAPAAMPEPTPEPPAEIVTTPKVTPEEVDRIFAKYF